MTGGITGYKLRNLIKSKLIGSGCFAVKSDLLFFFTYNLSYVTVRNSCVNIAQLIINNRYKPSHRFTDTRSNILAVRLYFIAIDIYICSFKCFFKKYYSLIFMFTQFNTLIPVDLLKFGCCSACITCKEIFYFQRQCNFFKKCIVIRQNDKNTCALSGKHTHGCFVTQLIACRCQYFKGKRIILISAVRSVINKTVKPIRVSATQF